MIDICLFIEVLSHCSSFKHPKCIYHVIGFRIIFLGNYTAPDISGIRGHLIPLKGNKPTVYSLAGCVRNWACFRMTVEVCQKILLEKGTSRNAQRFRDLTSRAECFDAQAQLFNAGWGQWYWRVPELCLEVFRDPCYGSNSGSHMRCRCSRSLC